MTGIVGLGDLKNVANLLLMVPLDLALSIMVSSRDSRLEVGSPGMVL